MNKVDLKIILLGASATGKTSLLARHLTDVYTGDAPSTVGASFSLKRVDDEFNAGLWDTAGQDRFDSISKYYCRGAGAALICFDLTDASTFEVLDKYVEKLADADPTCIRVLVGTKLDLVLLNERPRAVPSSSAQNYADTINAAYFETSAKADTNVAEAFGCVYSLYRVRRDKGGARSAGSTRSSSGVVQLDGAAPAKPDGGNCAC